MGVGARGVPERFLWPNAPPRIEAGPSNAPSSASVPAGAVTPAPVPAPAPAPAATGTTTATAAAAATAVAGQTKSEDA